MSSKKKLLIGLVVAVVFVGGAVAIVKMMVENGVEKMPAVQTGEAEASDYVGHETDCQPVDEHQWYRSDSTMTINPSDPNNLNIFIEKRGFFRSQDGGTSWAYKSKGLKGFPSKNTPQQRPCYLEFRTSVIDPTNPKRILVGLLGDMGSIDSDINQAGGLLESLDGGESWHQLLKPGMNAYVHDIAIDPTNPQTIYYVTSTQKGRDGKSLLTKGLVYKTTDNGKNWTELNTGLLPNTGGQEIHLDPKNPKRLVVTTLTFSFDAQGKRQPTTETLGILASDDAGAIWQKLHPLPKDDEAILTSAVAPTNFNNMYVSVMTDSGARSYYSLDAGRSFKRSGMPMDVVAYDPNVASGKEAYGYAWQLGSKVLWHTTDAGASWHQVGVLPADITSVQDPKQRISKIVVAPGDSKTVYLAAAAANVWKTIDQGKTWSRVLSLDTLP